MPKLNAFATVLVALVTMGTANCLEFPLMWGVLLSLLSGICTFYVFRYLNGYYLIVLK
jgi:hypothetical protein